MTVFDGDVFLRCHSIITDKRPFYFDSHKNADKHGKEETRRCVCEGLKRCFNTLIHLRVSVLVNVQTGYSLTLHPGTLVLGLK